MLHHHRHLRLIVSEPRFTFDHVYTSELAGTTPVDFDLSLQSLFRLLNHHLYSDGLEMAIAVKLLVALCREYGDGSQWYGFRTVDLHRYISYNYQLRLKTLQPGAKAPLPLAMEWEELKLGILALRRLGYAKIEAVQEGDAIYSVVHLTSTLLTLWKAITDR